jgi:multiple sugar transport system substrate-binding protein
MLKTSCRTAFALAATFLLAATSVGAADYDWTRNKGKTIRFLVNNNSLGVAVAGKKEQFEKLTGINLKVDIYQEGQMRQRLLTIMNARSGEIDVFMTLPSREGQQFAAAGWSADLTKRLSDDVAPDYNVKDLSKALLDAGTFSGKITSIPMNIEGPVLYWRKDIFAKCNIPAPARLDDVLSAAQAIAKCDPNITPFVSRGLKPAIAYTFSNFLHNLGGTYIKDGKSNLCSPEAQKALELYSTLLRDFGPPGVVNYSFQQIASLYAAGRVAMAFEASNQISGFLENAARLSDTHIAPLPAGSAGSIPTTIGWGLAISPFSKEADAAWLFVQWATSPDVQKILALEGIAPPRASVTNAPEYKAWVEEHPTRREWQAALDTLAKTGTSEVGYPIVANPESRDFIGQPVIDLLLKKKTVEQACADADTALNELIARK